MRPRIHKALALPLAAALIVAGAIPALAQEEISPTTISAIERGEAEPMVYLEGALLEAAGDAGSLFSDGTGTIRLDVAEDAGEGLPPLFKLIGIEGALVGDGIDVSRWAELPIFTPAVIVEEPRVIEAFRGWIIAYHSQAPTD